MKDYIRAVVGNQTLLLDFNAKPMITRHIVQVTKEKKI